MVTTRSRARANGNGSATNGHSVDGVDKRRKAEAHQFEFFGPFAGPVGIILGLPAVMYALVGLCGAHGCLSIAPLRMPGWSLATPLASIEASIAYVGWIGLVAALHLVLPHRTQDGVVLANGKRLKYRMNGLLVYGVVLAAIFAAKAIFDVSPLVWIYDHYLQIMTASVLFSGGLSVMLYIASHRRARGGKGPLLAKGGDTGYAVYDFFMGRELNPRIFGSFDLKEFCELYPGLIGWVVIDVAMAFKQYESLGYVTNSMLLVCTFHAMYVADALYFEKAILTTMDIVHDGFGFMLVFGDLAWVPFTYTLQARYLVDNPKQLSLPFAVFVLALNMVGYAAFRGSNSQKDMFRRNPNAKEVAHLKFLNTARGTKLIVSGWWGIARHINYTADWIMGLSWCLVCSFDHVIPYFYAIYFAILLIHRDLRDGEACAHKYGADWIKYCRVVRYRLVPFIY